MQDLHEIVRSAERKYTSQNVTIGKYVNFQMYDVIETITAYLNSKHISGDTDALGREKPFFNIVTAAVNIWYRATDIDRKDIRILPDSSDTVAIAMIATVLLQQWMKDARFGVFLNEWGRSLARYGSTVVKFVEKGGELNASVIPWNRFIADPIDFDAIPHIEKFYLTPEQLRERTEYDADAVNQLIDELTTRKTLDRRQQDTLPDFIELYEVHGRLPTYMLQDDPQPVEDEAVKYSQQMHVLSYVNTDDGEIKDFTLYRGKEARDPYMLTHLIKEDGRTLSIGAVEYLFDAQWMQNHTIKNMKDNLDLTSKIIYQTADPSFTGRNVISAIETGDILTFNNKLAPNGIEHVDSTGRRDPISSLLEFGNKWQQLAMDITSTPDALRGNQLPSGTPYSLAALQTQNAGSLFEIMTENKGLAIEDMMREWVLPHLMKKLNHKDEIVAILDEQGITEIDSKFVPREAIRAYNKQLVQDLIDGKVPDQFDQPQAEGQVRSQLGMQGNMRFFKPSDVEEKTWKQALSDFSMRCVVEVTNEATDKQAVLGTLSTVLQTIAVNPAILQDPNARLVFNQILSQTGTISPIQLSTSAAQPTPPPQPAPGQQPVQTAGPPPTPGLPTNPTQ